MFEDFFFISIQGFNSLLVSLLLIGLCIYCYRTIHSRLLRLVNITLLGSYAIWAAYEFLLQLGISYDPLFLLENNRYVNLARIALTPVSLIPASAVILAMRVSEKRGLLRKSGMSLLSISVFFAVYPWVDVQSILPENGDALLKLHRPGQFMSMAAFYSLHGVMSLLPVWYLAGTSAAFFIVLRSIRFARIPIYRQHLIYYSWSLAMVILSVFLFFPTGLEVHGGAAFIPLYLVMVFFWQTFQDFIFPSRRVVVKETILWFASTATILIFISYLLAALGMFTRNDEPFLGLLYLLLVFYFIFIFFKTLKDQYLEFLFHRDSQKGSFLEQYRDSLFLLQSPEKIAWNLMQFIQKFLYLRNSSLFMWSDTEGAFVDTQGQNSSRFRVYDPFIMWLAEQNRILTRQEILQFKLRDNERRKAIEFIANTESYIILPLVINNSLVGIVNLGEKVNSQPYSDRDLHILKEIHLETSIAISNSLLYERIKGLNANLEKKVEQRTAELKEAQQKLILSEKMASLGTMVAGIAHEINTPLSVIKGSIDNNLKNIDDVKNSIRNLFLNPVPAETVDGLYSFLEHQGSSHAPMDTRSRFEAKTRMREKLSAAGLKSRDRMINFLLEFEDDSLVDHFIEMASREHGRDVADFLIDLVQFQRNLNNASYSIENIRRIVLALKSYSHLDREKQEHIDITQGIENTLVILHNQLKKGIELKLNFRASGRVSAYTGELNQVWTNLLNNAVHTLRKKYGEEPGACITIDVFDSEDNKLVITEISDNGQGMNADVLQKVFDPFFTTKDQGEGTGLGMGIVKNIITRHKGDVEVESEPGRGTTFRILLPAAEDITG